MSDIFIKTAGSGSTGWKKMTNLFVKTASLGSTGWKAALGVWIRGSASWLKVWPLSGVFATRAAWFGPDSTTAYADRMPSTAQPVVRIGSNYYGNNAQWDSNGWTITSYSYVWQYFDGTGSGATVLGALDSGTGSGWTSGGTGQDLLPTTIWTSTVSTNTDRQYLGFKVTANASNSTYSGTSISSKVQIIRRIPQYTGSPSLSTNSPQVGTSITYTAPTWDTTEARKAESYRTTIYWYTNSTSTTTGGTYVSSGSSYTPVSGDIGKYIYAVETRYNSGTDYDLGATVGVEAKVVTTSAVTAGFTAPTSVSVSSVSRYSDTETKVDLTHSGGSGPYYQMYWVSSQTLPVTASYDAASNSSTTSISEVYTFSKDITYYFYVRSSNENIDTTYTNGTATAGTYGSYSDITPRPFYTFSAPTGGSISISGTSSVGSTLTVSVDTQPTASPEATGQTIIWRRADGGPGGNSFTGGSVMQTGGTTYVIDSPLVVYSSVGYQIRAEITFNNGLGTSNNLTLNSNAITVTAPSRATGLARRVTMPSSFTNSSQTLWVGTNGYVSVTADPTTSPGTSWPSIGGVVVGPGVADLKQISLSYKSDSTNFWVYWKGHRLGDTAKELYYLMKFTWNSATVDVYFEKYTLTDGSLDAVRNANSVATVGGVSQTWANSTSITTFSVPTGMTSDTTNDGVDDNRTAITATKPALAGLTPTFGTNTRTADGFTGSVTNYDTNYTWSGSVTASGTFTWGTASGSTRPFTVSGLAANTSSTVTITTTRTGYSNGSATTTATSLLAKLTPTFGTNTKTADGFTGSVTNYSTSYTWGISTSTGSVSWGVASGSTRPFTVSGVAANTSATVTVTTSRTDYASGSATTTETSLLAARTPTFGTNTSTSNGFTGSVTNYDTNWTWAISTSSGSVSFGTASGSTRPFTVTGLSAGGSATVTVAAARTGYATGSNTTTGSATAAVTVPSTPSAPTVTYRGTRNGRTYTWDVSFSFATGVTSMDVMNQYYSTQFGTYTSSPNDADPANYNIAYTYDGYIEFRNFPSGTAMPLTDANGYWDNTYSWMRARVRARNSAGSSGWSAWSGWA